MVQDSGIRVHKLRGLKLNALKQCFRGARTLIWVVVKIMIPFWIPIIIRHLIFRVPEKGDHNFDNHPSNALKAATCEGRVKLQYHDFYYVQYPSTMLATFT